MKIFFYDIGEWNEENESCQGEDVRKPGIPKSTSTPLKHNIPSSSKRQEIIDASSSMKVLCSETTLNKEDKNPTLSNAEVKEERETNEKQKEIECENDKMDVELDVKMKEEENIKDDDDEEKNDDGGDDVDVKDLEICDNGDTRIKNKEESSEESEEEEGEIGDGDKSEKSSDDSESERETEDSDKDSDSEGL